MRINVGRPKHRQTCEIIKKKPADGNVARNVEFVTVDSWNEQKNGSAMEEW